MNPVVDPLSGEPEFKHTPVRIESYPTQWQAFILSRKRLRLDQIDYWTCIRGEHHWRYECAATEAQIDWQGLARSLFAGVVDASDWMEFHDKRAGRYRCALMKAQQLQACLFIEKRGALPSRDWLGSLFNKAALTPTERTSLLSGSLQIGRASCRERV